MEFAKKVAFSDIHPFIFSPRSGTVAYKMQDLPHDVKKARLDKLLEVKSSLKQAFIEKMKGKTFTVIAEEFIDGYTEGYTENYIRAYVKGNIKSGEKIKVVLTEPYRDGARFEIIK